MNKELFIAQLKERLEEITECEVKVHQTPKNNGVKLTALAIMQEEVNVAPTIYAEPWYELYNTGEPFETIIEKIMEFEENHRIDQKFDFSSFLDFEKAKNGLRYKIVNTEKNVEILNSIPHKDFLDLSKVYYVEVHAPGIGNGTILISNDHMRIWGVTWEELDKIATEQTEKHSLPSIMNIKDFARNTLEGLGIFEAEENIPAFRMPPVELYAFTNQQRYLGANVILYKDVLKDFATEKDDDLYILPSSIHEQIVIPAKIAWYPGLDHLKSMVKEVNATQVEPEEFLSDNVYFYNRQTERIKIV